MSLDAWTTQAVCRGEDTEQFFLEEHMNGGYQRLIQTFCAHCPVRAECLDYALQEGIREGLWGGMSPRQRRTYKRSNAARRARLEATG